LPGTAQRRFSRAGTGQRPPAQRRFTKGAWDIAAGSLLVTERGRHRQRSSTAIDYLHKGDIIATSPEGVRPKGHAARAFRVNTPLKLYGGPVHPLRRLNKPHVKCTAKRFCWEFSIAVYNFWPQSGGTVSSAFATMICFLIACIWRLLHERQTDLHHKVIMSFSKLGLSMLSFVP
jgi:hypothetical protein